MCAWPCPPRAATAAALLARGPWPPLLMLIHAANPCCSSPPPAHPPRAVSFTAANALAWLRTLAAISMADRNVFTCLSHCCSLRRGGTHVRPCSVSTEGAQHWMLHAGAQRHDHKPRSRGTGHRACSRRARPPGAALPPRTSHTCPAPHLSYVYCRATTLEAMTPEGVGLLGPASSSAASGTAARAASGGARWWLRPAPCARPGGARTQGSAVCCAPARAVSEG